MLSAFSRTHKICISHTHFPSLHLYTPHSPAPALILLPLQLPVWKGERRVWLNRCGDFSCLSMDHNALRLPCLFIWVSERHFPQWQWKDLVARELLFVCFLLTNLQAGDTSGHRVLGSVDPHSVVWFRWLGTMWVGHHCCLFFLISCLLPFHPSFFAYVSYVKIIWSFFFFLTFVRRTTKSLNLTWLKSDYD